MTMTMDSPAGAVAAAGEHPGDYCTAEQHGSSEVAYMRGCRHPGAVASYQRRREQRRAYRKARPPVLDAEGNCLCPKPQNSNEGYARGCRHPGAIEARQRYLERQRARHVAHAEQRAALRRAQCRPGNHWRCADQRVSRVALTLLVVGMLPDQPTTAEVRAATLRLLGRPNVRENRRNEVADVALILGVSKETVFRQLRRIPELREQRAQRRLADARQRQWSATHAIARGRGHDASGHMPGKMAGR